MAEKDQETKSLVLTGILTLTCAYLCTMFYILGPVGASQIVPYIIPIAVYFLHAQKAGHLNPLVTAQLIITKHVESKPGLIRIGVQVIQAVVGSALARFSGWSDANKDTVTTALPYPTLPDQDALNDNTYSIAAIIVRGVLVTMLLGVVAVYCYKTKVNAFITALLYFITLEGVYKTNDYSMNAASNNPLWYLFNGLFFKRSETVSMFKMSFWWIQLLIPAVGVIGGALLAEHVIFKDGDNDGGEAKQEAIQSGQFII